MRTLPTLCALAAASAALAPMAVQAQPRPSGSYERLCTNIRMQGVFLSATCRGARGVGVSSINVRSCASDIGVDAQGGLVCSGPDVRPPPYGGGRPGDGRPGDGRPGDRRSDDVTLFQGRGMRGPMLSFDRAMPNLDRTGFNDRVASIQLDRRAGAWQVCTDANYRGRCTVIRRSVNDVRTIRMDRAISSLRPVR